MTPIKKGVFYLILGNSLNLYIAPIGTSGVREPRNTIVLKQGFGVIDDKFAGNPKKIDRSVMIVGTTPYNMAKEAGIELPEFALGENILLNFDPHTLAIGTLLEIGDAILEITSACTLCSHLTQYHKDLPKLIVKHRGVYCKILKSGIIKRDDTVALLKEKDIA